MKLSLAVIIILLISCDSNKTQDNQGESEQLQVLSPPVGGNSALPFLSKDQAGNLILSWVESNGDSTTLKFSSFDQKSWSTAKIVSSGSNWFVNWADYPSVVRAEDRMISHFLAKSGSGTYAYDVHLTQSNNKGDSWSKDYVPHSDGTPTEHGFATLLPYENGFFAAWLDGRNAEDSREEGGHGAMTVRGAFISASGELSGETLLDDRVCDCCQTGGAITENGPIIVYRDRSEEEIRDMSIVRFEDGEWTPPKTLHKDDWKIAGCPVNGPRASALGSNLAVAWFSAADQKSEVKVIFSQDNGATFGEAISVDNSNPIGRVDIAMIDKSAALVSWLDKTDNGAEIKATRISMDGEIKQSQTITRMDASRKSGFPQMEVVEGKVYFAWTEILDNDESTVRIAQFLNPG